MCYTFGDSSPKGSLSYLSTTALGESEDMMRNDITYRLLSIALIFPLISPISSGSGIIPFLTESLSQVNFDANKGISASVEVKDPELVAQIEELAMCESSGREDLKIVDTNGWHSYSCLQFQFPTFKQYSKTYGIFPEAEDADLMHLIGDCQTQKDLAYLMIKNDSKNWSHWENCSRQLGLLD